MHAVSGKGFGVHSFGRGRGLGFEDLAGGAARVSSRRGVGGR